MLWNNNNSNEPMGTVNNPIVKNLYVIGFEEGGTPIPPESQFRITDNGNFRITDADNHRVTDV